MLETPIKIKDLPEVLKTAVGDKLVIETAEGTKIISLGNVDLFPGHGAAAHNAFYRGKDITNDYTIEELSAKVRAGDFSNLYIGDYITKQVNIGGTNYNVKWEIADFDYFLDMGDTQCTNHHLVLMASKEIYNAQMNTSNTTAGGYVGSRMWTTEIPKINTGIKTAFGANHVLSHRELLSSAMGTSLASMAGAGITGAANSWAWNNAEANIPNEVMMYGTMVLSSSLYDVGDRKTQLSLFRHKHSAVTTRSAWWLSAVGSSADFCIVYTDGHANYASASNSLGVRPYFLFY